MKSVDVVQIDAVIALTMAAEPARGATGEAARVDLISPMPFAEEGRRSAPRPRVLDALVRWNVAERRPNLSIALPWCEA